MPRALYGDLRAERSDAVVAIFGQDVIDHYLNAANVERRPTTPIATSWDRERVAGARI